MSEQPGSAEPGPAVPQPARRHRLPRPLVVTIAAVVAVTAAAVTFGGLTVLRPYLSGEHPASLDTPARVAGLQINDDPQLQDAAVQLSAMLTNEAALDGAVAAFYTDPVGDDQLVLLAGGTGALRDPAAELDAAFAAVDAGGFPVTSVSPVDPGPLGGTARCGEATAEDVTVTVCGWADHGSLALMVFFNRPEEESAALLREVRAEVLTR